ncbi:uncharacterized protein LOC142346069 [Convolutriloba macropyga]|uniref:uncharacterized protein LOC142346069 n=1 Tax=Convolutriloba macropyga TaxID=536237 RepID=UPI003F51BAD3
MVRFVSQAETDEKGELLRKSEVEEQCVESSEDFCEQRRQHYNTYMPLSSARRLASQALEDEGQSHYQSYYYAQSSQASQGQSQPVLKQTNGKSCLRQKETSNGKTPDVNLDTSHEDVSNHHQPVPGTSRLPRRESVISFKDTVDKVVTLDDPDNIIQTQEPLKGPDSASCASSEFVAKRKEHYEGYMDIATARKLAQRTLDRNEESEYQDYAELPDL